MAKIHIDDALIRHLAELLDETGLTEIEVGTGRERLRVSRASVASSVPLVGQQALVGSHTPSAEGPKIKVAQEAEIVRGAPVKAPMVGTVYTAPEPEATPFVSVGGQVRKGDTLFIIEAMKTMNHVPSTKDGIVKKICVEDGQPVEFGQTIIVLE